MAIEEFQGGHRFLSNFYPAVVSYRGESYPTVEHAFQTAKTDNLTQRETIRRCTSPGKAKCQGRKVTLRPGWDVIKTDVMLSLLRLKFTQAPLRQLLLDTSDEELVEGNDWGDTFWGVSNGVGENWLGKLLMVVREEVRYEPSR